MSEAFKPSASFTSPLMGSGVTAGCDALCPGCWAAVAGLDAGPDFVTGFEAAVAGADVLLSFAGFPAGQAQEPMQIRAKTVENRGWSISGF